MAFSFPDGKVLVDEAAEINPLLIGSPKLATEISVAEFLKIKNLSGVALHCWDYPGRPYANVMQDYVSIQMDAPTMEHLNMSPALHFGDVPHLGGLYPP